MTVSGELHDPSHAAIPAAQLSLERGGKKIQGAETDAQGQFRFVSVAPGEYLLRVQFGGFQVYQSPLTVGRRAAPPLLITLNLDTIHQEVTVQADTAQVSTDTSENRNAEVLDQGMLQNLPVFDQDYIGTMSRFLDPGATATGGVTLVVDGVEANGPGVSPSAIQEVKINNDPYSAQFSRPGRGRIEIITKAGTSEYHGTFNFLYRDFHLNARDPFAITRPDEQRRIYEGYLSGPVGHSKTTSFLLSVDRQEQDLQSIVYAFGPAGAVQQNQASPTRRLFASGRINHQFTDSHQMYIGYSYEDRTAQYQGIGGFVLPEAGINTEMREDEITFNDRAVFTPHLSHQLRLLAGRYDAPSTSVNAGPRIVVVDAFTSGGAQTDLLRTERHWDGTELLTYANGRHLVKFGVDVPDWSRRGFTDRSNFGGTYYFSSLADYAAQRPFSYVAQGGNGHLVFLEKVVAGFVQDEVQVRPNLTMSAGVRYYWQNYFHDDPNNFAPRVALAWSPGKARKTVIRAGAGYFYDRTGPASIADTLRYNGTLLQRFVLNDPTFPVTPLMTVGAAPQSLVQLDPNVKIPYTIQYSAGVEQQVAKAATLSATYIGSRGISLFRSRDVNAPLFDLLSRPDPTRGQVRQIESAGRQVSDALELSFRGRLGKVFTGTVQYALSKTENNTGGIAYFPANSYLPNNEWGRADFDQRHRLNLLGSWTPGRWLNLGFAFSAATGAPYNITTGRDENNDSLALDRPAGVARNTGQGPGYMDLDLRWSHNFVLAKKKGDKGPQLNLAIDAFNVTNRVNYVTYIGAQTSPFFGQPIVSLPARRLQMGLRFQF